MQWQFPLEHGGRANLVEEGTRIHISLVYPDDRQGLYKAWILGGGGGRMLLGTLTPERGSLRLSRVMSRSALEHCGCMPPSGVDVVMTHSFQQKHTPKPPKWIWEKTLTDALPAPILDICVTHLDGGYLLTSDSGLQLAIPLRHDRPFPIPALFCFCEIAQVDGRECTLFHFNEEKMPIFSHK